MPASCGYHAPMRALTLLLAIASCTPAAPTVPDTAPLTQAVAVWRANPGPDSLQTVAELAGELGEHPVGAAGRRQRRPHRALAGDTPTAIYCSLAISCEKDHGLALR